MFFNNNQPEPETVDAPLVEHEDVPVETTEVTEVEAEAPVEEIHPMDVFELERLTESEKALKAEVEALKLEIEKLSEARAVDTARDGFKFVWIGSAETETTPFMIDGEFVKHVTGSVNGKDFKIPCDRQVEVADDIYEVLKPLLEKQNNKPAQNVFFKA